jgi:hypothetical protein
VVAIDKEQLCQDLNDTKELITKGLKAPDNESAKWFGKLERALDKLAGKYCK